MVVALPCVAQFVIVLDVTIVAIALPAMGDDLGLSTTALGWVITAYTLTFGGCLLAAGRLADRVGRRRAFGAGLILFGAASLACGVAPGGATLLAARAVQGVGAALVSPAALALLLAARPHGSARARALGWWTAAAAGGGAGGWILGGLLSGLLDWRWVFLLNVPICAAATALAPRVLARDRDGRVAAADESLGPVAGEARRGRPGATDETRGVGPATADGGRGGAAPRPDVAGAVLATAGLAALVLALTLAQGRGPLAAGTVSAAAGAAVLLAAFAGAERRAADPLLDGAVLRRPGVASANGVAAVLTATTSPAMFLCVLHAQRVLGLEPAEAGLLFPPFNAAVVAGSLTGPRVTGRVGERPAMAGGLAAVAAGALALMAIGPHAPALPSLAGGFVLLGAGLGVASVASTARGTAALGGADQGLASGLLATSAQAGTVLGLAVVVPLAAARTEALGGDPSAQVAGFELGFLVVAGLAAAAAVRVAIRGRAVAGRLAPSGDRA